MTWFLNSRGDRIPTWDLVLPKCPLFYWPCDNIFKKLVCTLKSKTFLFTLIITILFTTNVEAKYLLENNVNKIPSNQISINSQNLNYSNKTGESIEITNNSFNNSSEESLEDIFYGLIGLLVFVVLPLYWKPSRKAIGLMNIIIGTLISLTVIGAALGIPMIIFGGILLFI